MGARLAWQRSGQEPGVNWRNFDDFVHMGGYGLYVWGSYGVCLLALALEVWLAHRRERRARRAVIDEVERDR
jgi:heme exporter protein D